MTNMNTHNPQHTHPCLTHHDVVTDVCNPLKDLGVNFFGYTALDKEGNAYCLGSQYDYAAAYLQHNHVTADVHYRPSFKTKEFHYHFWDFVELDTNTEKLYQMAADFDQGHTLTVMRFKDELTQCYHFSGSLSNTGLNQRFLEKMDLIHAYIDYFDDCLENVPEIAEIYDYPTQMQIATPINKPFTVIDGDPRMIRLDNSAQTEMRFKQFARYYLTASERTCLSWLHLGKSAEMIAAILGVSRKTIERHVAAIKRKYKCHTMYQLGERIGKSGLSDLL